MSMNFLLFTVLKITKRESVREYSMGTYLQRYYRLALFVGLALSLMVEVYLISLIPLYPWVPFERGKY